MATMIYCTGMSLVLAFITSTISLLLHLTLHTPDLPLLSYFINFGYQDIIIIIIIINCMDIHTVQTIM